MTTVPRNSFFGFISTYTANVRRPQRRHIKMAYEEQTEDIKSDIRVNIPISLSSLSDGGAGSDFGAAFAPPSHGQLPYRQIKTKINSKL